MEFCERLYNSTNSTMRALESGIANITRHQYMQMCLRARRSSSNEVSPFFIIPYALIFLLSVAGNTLVILTLVRHKKMRTVTNVFLLNLAISDLLLALFCMPFTLVAFLMNEFIFGPVVCVLLRYAQAMSVGVSCGTLVAISLERFYAICQPLKSRRWQTLSHSYKVISGIWLSSGTLMAPIAAFNKEIELNNGAHACRELWPSVVLEALYTILLAILLVVVPLFLMAFSYGRISRDLWSEISLSSRSEPGNQLSESYHPSNFMKRPNGYHSPINHSPLIPRRHISPATPTESTNENYNLHAIRPASNCRVLANKKRVVKMLLVIVLEYFICWTPLNVINSWTVLDYMSARTHITLNLKSLILLLAYLSACIHPITYCFMNKKFRQSFADVFRCCFKKRLPSNTFYSDASHLNGMSDIFPARSSSANVRIMWKRPT